MIVDLQDNFKPPKRYGYSNTDWQYTLANFVSMLPSASYMSSSNLSTTPMIPQSYQEAIGSPHFLHWKQVMQVEYKSLIKNCIWDLTNLPFGCKAINYKWVYVLETKVNETIDIFKAQLVTKICSQKFGVNFTKTYSPIEKYNSICLILAIVAREVMHIR